MKRISAISNVRVYILFGMMIVLAVLSGCRPEQYKGASIPGQAASPLTAQWLTSSPVTPAPTNDTGAQGHKITLAVSPQSVSAGSILTADVQIVVPPDLPFLGWQFDLAFDPKLLKLNDVTAGDFLQQCQGKDTFFHPGKIDNAAGTLTGVAGAVLGLPQGCSGSGVIVHLNFTALGNGTPTYTLSNVVLADPVMRPIIQSYPAYKYALAGALRQTLDPALLATQEAGDITNSIVYKKLHQTPSPTQIAIATENAYRYSHPFPTVPPATPVYYAFQTTDDILKLVSKKLDSWKFDTWYHVPPCIKTGSPGTPVFVKSLEQFPPDYYLIPYSMDGQICGYTTFRVYQTEAGDFGTWGTGGWSEPQNGVSKYIFNGLRITSAEAKSLVQKAGFEILGEPRLVYISCWYGCNEVNPPWEVKTVDGQTLYVVYDYYDDMNAPVILTANGIITKNGFIKP